MGSNPSAICATAGNLRTDWTIGELPSSHVWLPEGRVFNWSFGMMMMMMMMMILIEGMHQIHTGKTRQHLQYMLHAYGRMVVCACAISLQNKTVEKTKASNEKNTSFRGVTWHDLDPIPLIWNSLWIPGLVLDPFLGGSVSLGPYWGVFNIRVTLHDVVDKKTASTGPNGGCGWQPVGAFRLKNVFSKWDSGSLLQKKQ